MNNNSYKQAEYLSGLNEQQLDAVKCPDSIVFVSAGPGTGKTHMLTSKLVYTIDTSVSPQSIVALSYTNTAARQLGERFRNKFEQTGIRKPYKLYNGTIHSFCFKLIRSFYKDFSQIILDDEELWELAEDIHDSLKEDVSTVMIMDCLKSKKVDLSPELYESICQVKEALQVMAIQDILIMFLNAISADTAFQNWIKDQITVIAVDEAQDLSDINYAILDKMLAVIPGLKIFLVGDPRQNIFEFNGGSYKNLYEFLKMHPNHVVKKLTITYRCGQAIADYVNTFQFKDCDNAKLESMCLEKGTIGIERSASEKDEAEKVITEVLEKGNLRNTAVLCNNLKYLGNLISLLIEKQIPYKVLGGRKQLKKHIRFLNHILRIIDSDNAYSIRKVAQYAEIDIVQDGKRKKSKFYESDLGQKILSFRDFTNLPFSVIAAHVISDIMTNYFEEEETKEDFEAFLDCASSFPLIADYLAAFATDREQFVQFYESDYVECPFSNKENYLTLSTIHSAKGLEWENVYIMGLCEGNFPNPYFCDSEDPQKMEEFLNAEWKKMYVASTRAKENLHLTYSSSIVRKGYTFRKGPSRFISFNRA